MIDIFLRCLLVKLRRYETMLDPVSIHVDLILNTDRGIK